MHISSLLEFYPHLRTEGNKTNMEMKTNTSMSKDAKGDEADAKNNDKGRQESSQGVARATLDEQAPVAPQGDSVQGEGPQDSA
eukprot:4033473-Amphidinium_carterae.1